MCLGHMMQYYPAVVFVATLLMVSSKLLLQKCQPSPRTTYTIVMACDLLCAALLVTVRHYNLWLGFNLYFIQVYFLLFRSFYCTLTHVTAFGSHRISFYVSSYFRNFFLFLFQFSVHHKEYSSHQPCSFSGILWSFGGCRIDTVFHLCQSKKITQNNSII